MQPELGKRPRVYYRHLQRLNDALVAGTVVAGMDTCLGAVGGA